MYINIANAQFIINGNHIYWSRATSVFFHSPFISSSGLFWTLWKCETECDFNLSSMPLRTDTSVGVFTLQWRHNGHESVSNHQPYDCLINRLFRRRSKKTPKLRVTGLCAGNSPGTGELPAQMASNAENVSIWWRHHDLRFIQVWVETVIELDPSLRYHLNIKIWLIFDHVNKTLAILRHEIGRNMIQTI